MTQMNAKENSSTVEEASKYVNWLLRHGNEETELSVDSRGWANVKDVRCHLEEQFPRESGASLLGSIISDDDMNRFNVQRGGHTSFIRATRDHSRSEVSLLDIDPDEQELTWFKFDNDKYQMWVEATSKEAGKKLLERRSFALSVPSPKKGEVEIDNFSNTERESVTESTLKNALEKGIGFSTVKVHQSARKPLSVDVRSNMGGYKGEYVANHPKRVRSRLEPTA